MRCLASGLGLALALGAALALVFALAPASASAQVPTLDRADSLVAAGSYAQARDLLDRWWSAREELDVPGSDLARAYMLRARLRTDPEEAESDYLAVVLGYPTSPLAPEALLRLGQGLLATGDPARAVAYLDRLASDYPGRADRPRTLLWLARANNAARRPTAACTVARNALADTRDPDLAAMLRVEAGASCSVQTGAPVASGTASSRDAAASEDATDQGAAAHQPDAAAGDWAVQTGAFRSVESAGTLVERLRDAGYSPRLVRVPRNDLLRVRVGRFTSSSAASEVVTRLRSQGFDAIVVSDAAEERRP